MLLLGWTANAFQRIELNFLEANRFCYLVMHFSMVELPTSCLEVKHYTLERVRGGSLYLLSHRRPFIIVLDSYIHIEFIGVDNLFLGFWLQIMLINMIV